MLPQKYLYNEKEIWAVPTKQASENDVSNFAAARSKWLALFAFCQKSLR